ncbi:hypothetical protein FLL45_04480 [Aliikangiella marina]|uniref:Uncharacterized protein n=1 Tax=Aliikangiella marina TaxID=1712262 RepID=A0A545TIZ9_9GAMM|nr:hypothetical protein [Aliikangiella marina]TQV77209.1 hypothetical protein FLL45_04480 [Aliikangiella marina]
MFLEYPIISAFLISAITTLAIIGLLLKLYIQPQQMNIENLEKHIDVLMDEVLELQQREHKRAQLISERKRRLKLKQNTIELTPITPQDVPVKAVKLVTNDLEFLLKSWNDKNLTERQRKTIEDNYIGKSVKWEVKVMSVSEEKDDKIWVTIVSPKQEIDSAHAVFDKSYKRHLLAIRGSDVVLISGTIERFFLAPVIVNCKLFKQNKQLPKIEVAKQAS